MAVKAVVLLLTVTLLGAAPACLCASHEQAKVQDQSCGHCPRESAPKDDARPSDCCCAHPDGDRASEKSEALSQPTSLSVEIDLIPELVLGLQSVQPARTPIADRAAPPRESTPLFILFRHLSI